MIINHCHSGAPVVFSKQPRDINLLVRCPSHLIWTAPNPFSKGGPCHHLKDTPLVSMISFFRNPVLIAIGKGRNIDQLVNQQFCFQTQLSLHHNRSVYINAAIALHDLWRAETRSKAETVHPWVWLEILSTKVMNWINDKRAALVESSCHQEPACSSWL